MLRFEDWLTKNIQIVPLVNWGEMHTRIAEMYACDAAKHEIHELQQQIAGAKKELHVP